MSCEIVTSPTTPLLSVEIIDELQTDFASKVYLDKVYPVAFIGEQELNDTIHKFPRVYLNDGTTEHIDVMPDDSLKGYTFFEINGIETYNRVDSEFTISISQIFWFNLRKIDDRGYDYKHELIADILKTYDSGSLSNELDSIEIEENFENIYNKYDLPQDKLQQFMYPFTGLKFSFEVIKCLDVDCFPEFTLIATPSDC